MGVLFISIPIQTHKHLWEVRFQGKAVESRVITGEGNAQVSFQRTRSLLRYVNMFNQAVVKCCWPAEPFSVTLHICSRSSNCKVYSSLLEQS